MSPTLPVPGRAVRRAPAASSAALPLAALLLSGLAAPAAGQGLTAEEYNARIEAAKKKAADFLLSKQRDTVRIVRLENQNLIVAEANARSFSVSGNTVRAGATNLGNVFAVLPPGWFDPDPMGDLETLNAGGPTGLCVLALLAAGVRPDKEPRLQKAIDCLNGAYAAEMSGQVLLDVKGRALRPGLQGTYALCIHAVVLEHLYKMERNSTKKTAIKKQLEGITRKIESGLRAEGGYDYLLRGSDRSDLSNTQYAMLALWAAHGVTGEVSNKTLTALNNYYLTNQNSDGGWPYTKPGESTLNMTAGAVASLMILTDILHTRGNTRPEVNPYKPGTLPGKTVESAAKGLEWFGRNFNPAVDGYLLYSTERIGLSTGQKRFGVTDWFRDGVEVLLKNQAADGSWPPNKELRYIADVNINTAFCLLFLAHGNSPVLINKLRYGEPNEHAWNNYPRDAANLTRWYNRTFEQDAGWQIVDFMVPDDFADAPILYISGAEGPNLTEIQVDEIRRYIDRGGTVLCVAAGNSKRFVEGIQSLGGRLYPAAEYPDYQMGVVPPDHPIYTLRSGEKNIGKIKAWHMHNGARSFLFLLPEDIAHIWNSGKTGTREECFTIVSNIKNYALDKALTLPPKLRPTLSPRDDAETLPVFNIAAVKYESLGKTTVLDLSGGRSEARTTSDWNCVPQGWKSLDPHLQHKAGMRFHEERGVSLTQQNLPGFHLVHMAGRKAFELSAQEKAGIKRLIANGGYMFLEDTGIEGDKREFLESARGQLKEIFPTAQFKDLPADHVLFTGKFPKSFGAITTAEYSRSVQVKFRDHKRPEMTVLTIDGRPAVFLSQYDLSSGLSGAVYYNRWGTQPTTSRLLVGNLVMYVRALRAKEIVP
jgi:hypothetical protein